MSDFIKIDIDYSQIDAMFSQLEDNKKVQEILERGLYQGAEVLRQSAKQSLRREMGSVADVSSGKSYFSRTYPEPMSEGIRLSKRKMPPYSYGINLLKDPRLYWFDSGTDNRVLKKNGAKRGAIPANHFFTKGLQSAEGQAINAIEQSIIKSLQNMGLQ